MAKPLGGIDDGIEILPEPDVAGVQHDHFFGEIVGTREGIVFGKRGDRLRVGPVVNDDEARRVGAFALDQARRHRFAEDDRPISLANDKSCQEFKDPIDARTAEVLQ